MISKRGKRHQKDDNHKIQSMKVLTRRSRLELKDEPFNNTDDNKESIRQKFLEKHCSNERNSTLTWNEEFTSTQLDDFVFLLMKMEKESSRLNAMIQLNKMLCNEDFSAFELRANSLIQKCSEQILGLFYSFNIDERIESLKVINNFIQNDPVNINDINPKFINFAFDTFPHAKELCKSLIISLKTHYPHFTDIQINDGSHLIAAIDNDSHFLYFVISIKRELIRFCGVQTILQMIHFSNDYSLLIDATKNNTEAKRNEEIIKLAVTLTKSAENKEQNSIGVASLCNILNDGSQSCIEKLKEDFELVKCMESMMAMNGIGTMASIALSFLEKKEKVIKSLQYWLTLERSVEVRMLIRKRIDKMS